MDNGQAHLRRRRSPATSRPPRSASPRCRPVPRQGPDEVSIGGLAARIDFSFADFVASRKGEAAARLREGAAYAYGGDLKVRAALDRVRPVTLAIEAAIRFWHSVGKNRLLGNAVRVGDRQFPDLQALLDRCVDALQIDRPVLYISPDDPVAQRRTPWAPATRRPSCWAAGCSTTSATRRWCR